MLLPEVLNVGPGFKVSGYLFPPSLRFVGIQHSGSSNHEDYHHYYSNPEVQLALAELFEVHAEETSDTRGRDEEESQFCQAAYAVVLFRRSLGLLEQSSAGDDFASFDASSYKEPRLVRQSLVIHYQVRDDVVRCLALFPDCLCSIARRVRPICAASAA